MLPLIDQHEPEIVELCRRYRVERLELIGSAATGEFDPAQSDLDFLVTFLPLQAGERADAYFGLLHGLEDLFGRKVDLVTRGAVRNPWFARSIEACRELLYAA
jgi:predicted nucleotidyltransferase